MTPQNLFAYCGNNPVNNTDTSGHIFAGAVIGGMAFVPFSYATGMIVKDAYLGIETNAINRMAKCIVEGVFEFNTSATQFVVDLF